MKRQLLIIFTLLLYTNWLQAQTVYEVSDFAGSGVQGSANGSGSAASFNSMYAIAVDFSGNLYVQDGRYKIRKITPQGLVSDFAGSETRGSANGQGSAASFQSLAGIATDASGNLFVIDLNKIRKITPQGLVSDFAGSGIKGSVNGKGSDASFNYPSGITIDASGNLYVSDVGNHKIRKITPQGEVSDFAGSGTYGSDNGQGSAASFSFINGIAIDVSGNIFVTDENKIRKISPQGLVSDFVGSVHPGSSNGIGSAALFNFPSGLAIDASGNLFVTAEYNSCKIRKITPQGEVSDFAGNGTFGSVNGIALSASFKHPYRLAFDASGNLYVTDFTVRKVRKISPKPPAPPVVHYDLPSSLCLGSTLNKTPAVTGSEIKLNLDQTTIATNPIKDICKGVNGSFFVLYEGDSIVKYNTLGQRVMRYDENGILSNIRKIAVDSMNRVYAWSNGINTDAIHRIGNDGIVEFSGFITPTSSFTNVTDMKVGFDNFLYVADDVNAYITKVDPSDATMTSFAAQQGVTSMSFGKEEMYIFKAAEQKVYATDLTAANFTEVFQGLSDLNLNFDDFEYDTSGLVGVVSFFVSSKSKNKVMRFPDYGYGFDISSGTAIDYTNLIAINQPLAISQIANSNAESVWVATGDAKLISLAIYSYKVSPALPEGLSFDILKGTIKGTPTTTVPATTYTIEINSDLFGTNSYTINFSVDATSSINNSTGTATSSNEQSDGLKINYFDVNNCQEIMAIKDEKGGTIIGNVEVKQDVLPTLASFASGSFVRRVTEVNTQNPDAQARLTLYFTKEDIDHYNSTNGPSDPDLSNDIVGGTMEVAILQLHTDDNGVTEQIKHSPITAKWDATKLLWVVDFPITKFSTFYMGESSSIGGFDCSSTGPTITVTSCGFYIWRDKAYTQTGVYKDTTANQFGCDSILTLDLTVTNDFEITQDQIFPENLTCNTSGATYQWINCDNGGIVLNGETNQTFTATYNGSYSVIATYNSCKDTSLCVTVTGLAAAPTGIQKGNVLETLSVYPNPGTGVYRIESVENYKITVRSALGEVLVDEKSNGNITDIDLIAYPGGIYHLTIQTETSGKTVKLIKN